MNWPTLDTIIRNVVEAYVVFVTLLAITGALRALLDVHQAKHAADGLPIEIYVFSGDKRWAAYEDIQAGRTSGKLLPSDKGSARASIPTTVGSPSPGRPTIRKPPVCPPHVRWYRRSLIEMERRRADNPGFGLCPSRGT